MKEKIDDAKEFWETSQNPVVYALSGVWDNMTGETEEGICVTEILKLDPGFEKEEWSEEVRVNVVPDIIKAHLTGDTDFLAEHLGEGVLNKLTQDIKLRESDKIEFDSNLLDVDENQIMMKYVEDHGPVIVGTYMVQQINCIRKAGEIIEGSESAVVAKKNGGQADFEGRLLVLWVCKQKQLHPEKEGKYDALDETALKGMFERLFFGTYKCLAKLEGHTDGVWMSHPLRQQALLYWW